MYAYMKGIITEQTSNQIILETNKIGYEINVPNPYSYELNKEVKVYLYEHIREDEHTLYGFKNIEEKELFLKLINVKGLGPKMAIPMLATGSINGIVDAIDRENVVYLTKFPKIGDKLARQIILDLKGKLAPSEETANVNNELVEVLTGLGYKGPDIKKVLPNIDYTKTIEEQIKQALQCMLK